MFVIHTKNQPLDIFRLVAMPTFMVTFSILAMQLYLLQNEKTIKEEKIQLIASNSMMKT